MNGFAALRKKYSGWLVGGYVLTAQLALAQPTAVLTGRVLDKATKEPIPFASVYVGNTTKGTTANADGAFALRNVPAGSLDIIASAVGYVPERHTLDTRRSKLPTLTYLLTATPQSLTALTVTARRPKAYDRYLRTFRRELLGETPQANKCTLLNPDVLRFSEQDGHLRVAATAPLIVDNQALGYRIYYDLMHFDTYRGATYYAGGSRFEPLETDKPDQRERWERQRQLAYWGSSRHMLASLAAGTYEQEGYMLHQATFPVPKDPAIPLLRFTDLQPGIVMPDSVLRPGDRPTERWLVSQKPLEILYVRRRGASPYPSLPYAYSLLILPQGQALIATTGAILLPMGLEIRGAMSSDRLSTLLPTDWEPPQTGADPSSTAVVKGSVLPPDARLDSLMHHATRYQQQQPLALYLHTDKGHYLTGDRLWMSGYVLDPQSWLPTANRPNGQTEAVQIELLDPAGQRRWHQWHAAPNGRIRADWQLPDSLATGVYTLRAIATADASTSPTFERQLLIVNALHWQKTTLRPNVPTSPTDQPPANAAPPGTLATTAPGGATLTVNALTDSTQLNMAIRLTTVVAARPVYLVVQSRGKPYYRAKLNLQAGEAQLNTPRGTLPEGMACVSLFGATGTLQAQQLAYVLERLGPAVAQWQREPDQAQPRSVVSLSVKLATTAGEPVSLIGSAVAVDADQVPADTGTVSLRTHLLRSNQKAQQTMWQPVADSSVFNSGITLRGRVLSRHGQPLVKANLLLRFIGKEGALFARSASTDAQGRFSVDDLTFRDTVQVRIRVMDARFKPTDATVIPEPPGPTYPLAFTPRPSPLVLADTYWKLAHQRQAADPATYREQGARLLQEVTIKAARADEANAQRSRLHSEPDAVLTFDQPNAARFANLYEMIRGRLAGVNVTQTIDPAVAMAGYTVRVRGFGSFSPSPPLYLVDGVPVPENADGTALLLFNTADIERIELLKNSNSAMYGSRGATGVIAFYSRKTSPVLGTSVSKGEATLTCYGFATHRPFSVPTYAPTQTDRRDVLNWLPTFSTNEQGTGQLSFTLSDVARRVRITIQGVTTAGQPVWVEQVFQF
jgi:hypothetical protein